MSNLITLSDGVTHYRVEGPIGGIRLILIHGATVPFWVFDRLTPLLIERGFQVLRYDLLGHGGSSLPEKSLSYDLLVSQLTELLETLEWEKPFNIISYSLGAPISMRFVLEEPSRLNRMILVAPMINYSIRNPGMFMFKLPKLGEWLMRHFVIPLLIRRRHKRYSKIGMAQLGESFEEMTKNPEFLHTLLSLIRNGLLSDQSKIFEEMSSHKKKLMLIGAKDDRTLPIEQFEQIYELLGNPSTICYQGMGHNMILSHAEFLINDLINFFWHDVDIMN